MPPDRDQGDAECSVQIPDDFVALVTEELGPSGTASDSLQSAGTAELDVCGIVFPRRTFDFFVCPERTA